MNLLSYMVLAAVAVALVFAVRGIRRNRCTRGCEGCAHRNGCVKYPENNKL